MASHSFIRQEIDSKGVCSLFLRRPPVNGMSPTLLQQLREAISSCDKNTKVKAVLIKSDSATTFSAGLDLFEVVKFIEQYKNSSDAKLLDLVGDALSAPLRISKPVACVVAGHAIAGGFVLAAACDFVALQKPKDGAKEYLCGVTETRVGLPWPRVPLEIVRNHVDSLRGFRELAYRGENHAVSRALELGFGDYFGPKAEEAALNWIHSMLALAPQVFELSKRQINAAFFRSIQDPDKSLTLLLPPKELNLQTEQAVNANSNVIAGFAETIKQAKPKSKL